MWKSLVCVTLLFVTDIVVCKPDYLFNKDVNGWLKLHVVPANWQQAFLNCHYEGAVLASPVNAQFATAMSSIVNQSELDSSIFLGVNAGIVGDFISIEGVPLADLSITWGTNGDGNTPEDCLSLSPDGKTYISSCKLSLPYICYKKRDNTTILNRCGTFDDDYQYCHVTGSCYKYHNKQSWTVGNKICAAEGGHLVIINDNHEADIVKTIMSRPTGTSKLEKLAYIGLRSWINGQTWLTVHGEKIENMFNKWYSGDMNNRGVGCAVMDWSEDYLTYNTNCGAEYRFICEKNPKSTRFENVSDEVY